MKNKHALTSYEELKKYLDEIEESFLLEYVERDGDRYTLNIQKCQDSSKISPQSVRLQVATVFSALGEHSIANEIHTLKWDDLNTWGDKVSNGILQRFIAPWPRTNL